MKKAAPTPDDQEPILSNPAPSRAQSTGDHAAYFLADQQFVQLVRVPG
jgi:hypothetical protein